MSIPKGSLISYMSTKVKNEGGINLAQGIPGIPPPERLCELLSVVAKEQYHQYPPGTGNTNLKDSIMNRIYQTTQPLDSTILITQGATEALNLTFLYLKTKLKKPFAVLSFSPAYESYRKLPESFSHPYYQIIPNETSHLPLKKIEQYITDHDVRLIFLASPGNPYGYVFSKNEIEALVELCQFHQCYLMFDAVYESLYFEEKPFVPYYKMNPYLFIANSFSKLWSITGWRVGYLLFHPTHADELFSLHDYVGLCANSTAQEAIARYANETDFGNSYTQGLRKQIKENYDWASHELSNLGFFPSPCKGGYFIWTELPQNMDDGFSFCENLYSSQKVACVPGIHFNSDAQRMIRINIARPIEELRQGIEKIREYTMSFNCHQ